MYSATPECARVVYRLGCRSHLVDDVAAAVAEFLPKTFQLPLVLTQERLLVEILVHVRLVLNVLRAVRKLGEWKVDDGGRR